jgi:serine/threonine protein kinase
MEIPEKCPYLIKYIKKLEVNDSLYVVMKYASRGTLRRLILECQKKDLYLSEAVCYTC